MSISIKLLGELAVFRDNLPVKLPSSKRTRAFLAYLVMTTSSHSRARLCELLWKNPDDPRGALRWSLSKIRPLLNDKQCERLIADRQQVGLQTSDLNIDLFNLRNKINSVDISLTELQTTAMQLCKPLLVGLDLPSQPLFQQWLNDERQNISSLRAQVLARLSLHPQLSLFEQLKWSREWFSCEPLNPQAATQLLKLLQLSGYSEEAYALSQQCKKRFFKAGITWSADPINEKVNQQVQYCQTSDGVKIAHASIGKGFPMVKAAAWLSHLEHDWAAPVWGSIFESLSAQHRFVRYDGRASGLSDWTAADISFAGFVEDLEAVIAANQLEKFALLGVSQGAAISIAYALKYPERVSHLILFSAYSSGWLVDGDEQLRQRLEAIMALAECGWEQENPAFRQFFSMNFIPDATTQELDWFNQYQRRCVSPTNAVRLISAFGKLDVRDLLAKIKVPTLVIHSLHDECIEVKYGRDMAASIPNAEFVGLESRSHLLLGREPAAQQFVAVIEDFIARH